MTTGRGVLVVVQRDPTEADEDDLYYRFGDVAGSRLQASTLRVRQLPQRTREGPGECRTTRSG
jgi:hypothetical protein